MAENLMAYGAVPFPINDGTRLLIKRTIVTPAPGIAPITVIMMWHQFLTSHDGWRTTGPATTETYAPPSIQMTEADFPAFLKVLNSWEKFRGMI